MSVNCRYLQYCDLIIFSDLNNLSQKEVVSLVISCNNLHSALLRKRHHLNTSARTRVVQE